MKNKLKNLGSSLKRNELKKAKGALSPNGCGGTCTWWSGCFSGCVCNKGTCS